MASVFLKEERICYKMVYLNGKKLSREEMFIFTDFGRIREINFRETR